MNKFTKEDFVEFINGLIDGNGEKRKLRCLDGDSLVTLTFKKVPFCGESIVVCDSPCGVGTLHGQMLDDGQIYEFYDVITNDWDMQILGKFEITDEIEEAVNMLSSVLADAFFEQSGLHNVRNDVIDDGSDNSYYETEEQIRTELWKAVADLL